MRRRPLPMYVSIQITKLLKNDTFLRVEKCKSRFFVHRGGIHGRGFESERFIIIRIFYVRFILSFN